MRFTTDSAATPWSGKAVLALGVFDGVHIGHRQLITAAVRRAVARGVPSVVVTFDPHPLAVTRLGDMPPLLTSLADRLRFLGQLGVDYSYLIRFTNEIARLSAEEFAAEMLDGRLHADTVFVGFNYRFGEGGRGTAASLSEMGAGLGFGVEIVPAVTLDGQPVSSSLVRQAILGGEVELAARMLGRHFELSGMVIREHGRGRKLGFPTANVQLSPEIAVPAPGVYAVTIDLGDGPRAGVANLGTRPTFGGGDAVGLEIHIFDFSGDVYGQEVRTSFVGRLRGERKFDSAEQLREQIGRDCDAARCLVGNHVYKAQGLC